MNIIQAIEYAGTASELARILGVKRQAVHNYRTQGLPPKRVLQLKQLRPEWFKTKKPLTPPIFDYCMKDRTYMELRDKYGDRAVAQMIPEAIAQKLIERVESPCGTVYRSVFPGVDIDAAHKIEVKP